MTSSPPEDFKYKMPRRTNQTEKIANTLQLKRERERERERLRETQGERKSERMDQTFREQNENRRNF